MLLAEHNEDCRLTAEATAVRLATANEARHAATAADAVLLATQNEGLRLTAGAAAEQRKLKGSKELGLRVDPSSSTDQTTTFELRSAPHPTADAGGRKVVSR